MSNIFPDDIDDDIDEDSIVFTLDKYSPKWQDKADSYPEASQDTPCNAPGCPVSDDQEQVAGTPLSGRGPCHTEPPKAQVLVDALLDLTSNDEMIAFLRDGIDEEKVKEKIRTFDTGASRDTEEDKLDYEGFESPVVLQRFAEYMHQHRKMKDGSFRDSDNWQNGIPIDAYMKSLLRHIMDLWLIHRGYEGREDVEEALCGILFNAKGYLYEVLK